MSVSILLRVFSDTFIFPVTGENLFIFVSQFYFQELQQKRWFYYKRSHCTKGFTGFQLIFSDICLQMHFCGKSSDKVGLIYKKKCDKSKS